jgi:hypothetical protein
MNSKRVESIKTTEGDAIFEIREDRHPVGFISGKDIVDILIDKGYNTKNAVMQLLTNEFSK